VKRTTLVLLPALDGTALFFEPLIEVLPAWIKPLVVTYPTSGRNDYAELYPIVEHAVREESKFFVLGWSFSGPLALTLAAKHRSRVRGVILCASFVSPPIAMLRSWRFAIRGPVVALARAIWRMRFWINGYTSDRFRQAKSVTWSCVSSRTLAARGRAIMRCDARGILMRCEAPLLYLAGSRDRVVKERNAEEILRLAPATRLARIEGNHYAIFMNPTAAATVLAEFLAPTSAKTKK
jgi:pimeloyl-[acyl-carrier protein] methyl ester esterase